MENKMNYGNGPQDYPSAMPFSNQATGVGAYGSRDNAPGMGMNGYGQEQSPYGYQPPQNPYAQQQQPPPIPQVDPYSANAYPPQQQAPWATQPQYPTHMAQQYPAPNQAMPPPPYGGYGSSAYQQQYHPNPSMPPQQPQQQHYGVQATAPPGAYGAQPPVMAHNKRNAPMRPKKAKRRNINWNDDDDDIMELAFSGW